MVGRYPANYLIPQRPVPRRLSFGKTPMPKSYIAGDYPQFPAAIPNHGVGYRRLTHPCATDPPCGEPVRLACLIHAANVHSEPGSNPSQWCHTRVPASRPSPRCGPHLERLRKKNWSQQAQVFKTRRPRSPLLAAGPVLPIPPRPMPPDLGDPGVPARRRTRRLPSRVPHNAMDEFSSISFLLAFSFSG